MAAQTSLCYVNYHTELLFSTHFLCSWRELDAEKVFLFNWLFISCCRRILLTSYSSFESHFMRFSVLLCFHWDWKYHNFCLDQSWTVLAFVVGNGNISVCQAPLRALQSELNLNSYYVALRQIISRAVFHLPCKCFFSWFLNHGRALKLSVVLEDVIGASIISTQYGWNYWDTWTIHQNAVVYPPTWFSLLLVLYWRPVRHVEISTGQLLLWCGISLKFLKSTIYKSHENIEFYLIFLINGRLCYSKKQNT